VSFFGGGTDYPEYFSRHRGAVVGMAINRYIYISVSQISSFVNYKYRLSYSSLEMVHNISEIKHPVVRAVFEEYGIDQPLDVSIISNSPASAGLGSSSSFTVGLLNLIAALRDERVTKLDLAKKAIYIEQEVLEENVGVQDQLHASYGGINRFDFTDNRIRISPLQMTGECQRYFLDSLMLVFTDITRHASKVVEDQVGKTLRGENDKNLERFLEMTDEAVDILEDRNPDELIRRFGALIDESWRIKRQLSATVSNPTIDSLYEACLRHGALGGKLLGAGSGGFLLVVVPPEQQEQFVERVGGVKIEKIDIDTMGSIIQHS